MTVGRENNALQFPARLQAGANLQIIPSAFGRHGSLILKTVFSRMGENSKIIALGNAAQVDVKYLSAVNNGAIVATETFKNFEGAAHISLNGVVRSKLAAFTEENM